MLLPWSREKPTVSRPLGAPLTPEEVTRYEADGFLTALPVLTPEEAAVLLRRAEMIERVEQERRGGDWKNRSYTPRTDPTHPLRDLYCELATHPRVLDIVERLLGPNILVRNADLFIKEPRQRGDISWHIDSARPVAETKGMLTAWIGLTASTRRNGCIEFVPGSHREELPDGPRDRFSLHLTAKALRHLDTRSSVSSIMLPGQMSLHSLRTVHRSGPNRTAHRRFGFAIRYMAAETSPEAAEAREAMLVRGAAASGGYTLLPAFPVSWWEG